MIGGWLSVLLESAVVVIVFGAIAAALLPRPLVRAGRRGGALLAGGLFGLALMLVFTVIDALITVALTAYHAATARPYLLGDDWLACAHRANDRLMRVVVRTR